MVCPNFRVRGWTICLLLAAVAFTVNHVVVKSSPRVRFSPKEQLSDWKTSWAEVSTSPAATATVEIVDESTSKAPTEAFDVSDSGLRVASGALKRPALRVLTGEPPLEDFAPVYVEEVLMNRPDFRIWELRTLNLTVDDPSLAVFYMVCCGPLERMVSLPARSPERPYLCYDCDMILKLSDLKICMRKFATGCSDLLALLERRDFMFSSTDLRLWDLMNDSALLLPGITHAHHIRSPEWLKRSKVNRTRPPRYFVTFQGARNLGLEGSSYVRLNLEAKMNSSFKPPKGTRGPNGEWYPLPEKTWTPPEDVWISIAPANVHKTHKDYYELFNSDYSLVLHGHGRWSYRFLEALCGEAIPVIMADGWELPFSELIHWDQLTVRRPESLGFDPEKLVGTLPRDPEVLEATRENIREVYQKLFSTQEQRLFGLLRSAALWKRNWRQREQQTLRMLLDQAWNTQRNVTQKSNRHHTYLLSSLLLHQ